MQAFSLRTISPRLLMTALLKASIFLILGLVIGLVTSTLAIGFTNGVYLLNDWLLISEYARFRSELDQVLLWVVSLIVPMIGGMLVAVLTFKTDALKRPVGPADVIKAIQLQTNMPPIRSGFTSTVSAFISLSVGASVGQYGPMVYMGAMLGKMASQMRFAIPNLAAICVGCGVAAAISAAFNAPIAGLIFAHEVILRHYSMQAFAPITVAATTGYVMANMVFDRTPILLVQTTNIPHGEEFLLFALLGLLSAGVAIAYMKCILLNAQWGRRFAHRPVRRGAAAGLVVGLCIITFPELVGLGQVTLRLSTLEGAFLGYELTYLIIGKIFLTAFCLGFGFVGGVFSPALVIGAMVGGLFWTVLSHEAGISLSEFPIYVICAMMAVTSPVIGAPLSAILIVFELTRSYDMAIASMIAVVFSNALAFRLFGRSLFDRQLKSQNIDLSKGRDQAQLEALSVIEFTDCNHAIYDQSDTEAQVAANLRLIGFNQGFLRDPDTGRFVGVVELYDLDQKSRTAAAGKVKNAELIFTQDTNVLEAMEKLKNFVGDAVPVINTEADTLLGVISEAKIIQAYLNMVNRLRQEEHATL